MEVRKIKEFKEAWSEEEANSLLSEGWEFFNLVGSNGVVVYVFAKFEILEVFVGEDCGRSEDDNSNLASYIKDNLFISMALALGLISIVCFLLSAVI